MKRLLTVLLFPPLAVCRYGCAACCAAPIAVFWIAAVVALIYAPLGGPARLMGTSWEMVGLGVLLWSIAATWAGITIRGSTQASCEGNPSTLCKTLHALPDEADPLDELRRTR